LYEGLFLIDSGEAASDWKGINTSIENILGKAGAEVVSMKKWDERRLAYEISGQSRGTYILTYFNCDPTSINSIERDVQLSEQIMRVLILRTDKMSSEDMEKDTPAMVVEAGSPAAEAKTEVVPKEAEPAKEPVQAEKEQAPVEVVVEPEPETKEEAEPVKPLEENKQEQ
jgi:small subunit ribosomal protein S6